jgi:hypothetical protein
MSIPRDYRKYGWIYFIEALDQNAVKIGYTANRELDVRLIALQVGSPSRLRPQLTIPGFPELEKFIHRVLDAHGHRIRGEWFDTTDGCVDAVRDMLSFSHRTPDDPPWYVGFADFLKDVGLNPPIKK